MILECKKEFYSYYEDATIRTEVEEDDDLG